MGNPFPTGGSKSGFSGVPPSAGAQNTIFGGLSPFDVNVSEQATTQNVEAMRNRYAQLGIENPGADPRSPTPSGPSTMEQQDVEGANLAGAASLGNVENASLGPAPGSALNNAIQLFNAQEAAQNQTNLQQSLGQLAGLSGFGGTSSGGPGSFGSTTNVGA